MANNYILSLQPTFTQGLILGQLSILVLLVLVLKYLFLDSTKEPFETSSYHPRVDSNISLGSRRVAREVDEAISEKDAESAEWFNKLAHQVAQVYRSKLRDDTTGVEGDEIARRRIEDFANRIRPAGFLDHIKIDSIDLGDSAPRLSNARVKYTNSLLPETEVDVHYTDSISISLSTSYLFNYPMASFARLPVSLTISLSIFKASVSLKPPSPDSPAPVATMTIAPDFTLDLTTTSLMGSRAKLANVPKLHQLIQHQVRRILAARSEYRMVLPGLASVAQAE